MVLSRFLRLQRSSKHVRGLNLIIQNDVITDDVIILTSLMVLGCSRTMNNQETIVDISLIHLKLESIIFRPLQLERTLDYAYFFLKFFSKFFFFTFCMRRSDRLRLLRPRWAVWPWKNWNFWKEISKFSVDEDMIGF